MRDPGAGWPPEKRAAAINALAALLAWDAQNPPAANDTAPTTNPEPRRVASRRK